jgi:hypothetical protein
LAAVPKEVDVAVVTGLPLACAKAFASPAPPITEPGLQAASKIAAVETATIAILLKIKFISFSPRII